jgi:Pregnancy-associated plasma protein-A
MIVPTNFTVFVWTIIVSAWYRYTGSVQAHDDSHHYHSTNEKHFGHAADRQDHHHGHFHHGGSVDTSRIRSRTLVVNDIFNTTSSSKTDGDRCGTHEPTAEVLAESSRIVQKWMESPNARQTTTINVKTYFHIVTAYENNETIGNITDTDVVNQLQVLNDSYLPYGFTFTLMGTTRSNNSDWYYNDDEFGMKSALRVGDASTLNVYFTDPPGLVGYATFPWNYEQDPVYDGVVVQSGTIPGGSSFPYDEGKTLVHEVGHWLGLFHTFQTNPNANYFNMFFLSSIFGDRVNCWYNTDEVRDTPKQRYATRGCPTGRNSCVLNPGFDPIHNYMDYSDDFCYTEFTNGQTNRMKAMWNEYRA